MSNKEFQPVATGTKGDQGLSGYSGARGITGSSGWSGYSGFSGYSGKSGYSGIGNSGYSGYSGYSGVKGSSGYSGNNGFSGYSGYSGKSGWSGWSGVSGVGGISGTSGWSGRSGYSGIGGSGYSGYSGLSGYSGYSGKSGYSGSGVSGYSGYSGVGLSGYSGRSGYSGLGLSGYSGISGLSGYSGYSGSGLSGYSGTSGYSGNFGGNQRPWIFNGTIGNASVNGRINLNNALPNLTTNISVALYDASGQPLFSWIMGLANNVIVLAEEGNSGSFNTYLCTAVSSFHPGSGGFLGRYDLTVTYLNGAGTYANGDSLLLTACAPGTSGFSGWSGYSGYSGQSGYSGFSGYSGLGLSGYSGKSGYSGLSGYSGVHGFSGVSGVSGNYGPGYYPYNFVAGTANTSPGSGNLSFDNVAYNLATTARVDFGTSDGNNIQTIMIAVMGVLGSYAKGFITITSESDSSVYVVYLVTAFSINFGIFGDPGYGQFTVEYIGGSTSGFNSGDPLLFGMTPAGISGTSGWSGTSGVSGFVGTSGYSGLGLSGYSGISGAATSGWSGYSGNSGYSGYSGYSGSGFSGYSGFGTSGYSGLSGYSGAAGGVRLFNYGASAGVSGAFTADGASPTATTYLQFNDTDASGFDCTSWLQNVAANPSGALLTLTPAISPSSADYVVFKVTGTEILLAGARVLFVSYLASSSPSTWPWSFSLLSVNVSLIGSSGYSGYSGISGVSASTSGYSGYSGANPGASGYSGYSGRSGYSGAGLSGYSGYSGSAGGAGLSGYSGYSGVGLSGYSGYSGAGLSGYSGYSGGSGWSGYSGVGGSAGGSGYSGYSGAGISGYSGYSGVLATAFSRAWSTITFGSTTNTNASTGNNFKFTATSAFTLANPTSPSDGQILRWKITQDGTGGRIISWGTNFKGGTGGLPVLSTAPNVFDIISAVYDSDSGHWCVINLGGLGFN